MKIDTANKNKPHQTYRLADGTIVPGVTTVTGGQLGWSKEILCNWNNKMGLAGVDTKKFVDEKADIGTLAHLMITNELSGVKTDTDEYSKYVIGKAKNAYKSWGAWAKHKSIQPIFVEKQIVSNIHKFGGTADIFAIVDGFLELIDLKTGSGIYDEFFIQVGGGYWTLLNEYGLFPMRARILNIPRADDELFIEKIVPNIKICQRIFLNCLANYQDHKLLKKEG